MTNEELTELTKAWFDNIESICTRKDISDEDKMLRIEATCQRCKNFLNDRGTCEHHKDKFRLPTKEEFERLCECFTRFDKELKGRWFFDSETGEHLLLPCKGYRDGTTYFNVGLYGSYWSSAYYSSDNAYLGFNSRSVYPSSSGYRDYGRSVRLVSDEPFEGAIHVAGLYWKPKNEEGFYTYDLAMSKFNK